MKQKYSILKNSENSELIIREFAELNKEIFSMLCQETYPEKDIKSAISRGKEELITTLRRPNMYPVGILAEQIADEIINLYKSKDVDSKEIFFDDIEILSKDLDVSDPTDGLDSEAADIDELLEDDTSDSALDDDAINDITTPIKIADDDSADMEDQD